MLGKLISLSKNGEEKELPVVNLHFFIGSDLFCDLRLKHKDIAAQHCLITSQKDKPALIRNLSRSVPTLVNNTEIGTTDVELKDQDIITIRHKTFRWRYNDSSEPSTSSQTSSFGASSKNRKSWPLFKNKLVAVVTPQRRDEQREVLPKKRRGTVGGEISSNTKPTAPKVLALKSGLKATHKRSFGKRKSSVKTSQQTTQAEITPQPPRKSVKFLDTSAPRSRLGKRGTPYQGSSGRHKSPRKSVKFLYTSASRSRIGKRDTPCQGSSSRHKVSVYHTPPSTFGHDRLKPVKSILKTPGSSSSTASRPDYGQNLTHLVMPSLVRSPENDLATPLSDISDGSRSLVVPEDDLLRTPPKADQPEVVMRSSRRKAAIVKSPPSTPKSATKKRKSIEEKSIEASERAAKKLKQGPPHAIDEKKRAALLKCHRKSLTPHPIAKKGGKLITKFPSSFTSRFKAVPQINTKPLPKLANPRKSEPVKFSTSVPKVFRFSSLGESGGSEAIPSQSVAISKEVKLETKKSLSKSTSRMFSSTSPIIRKLTRASRAARASRELQRRAEVDDVLSALDLSRRWPPPSQVNTSSPVDVSNLSGFKKLFHTDKTLDAKDVRELFLETSNEPTVSNDNYFQTSPDKSDRSSRRFSILKASKSNVDDEPGFVNSFHSQGAQEQPCSESLLSGSLLSVPSYSSTSRRSLSLKRGRKSTLSPTETPIKIAQKPAEGESIEAKIYLDSSSDDNLLSSGSRKGRRSRSFQSNKSIVKGQEEESLYLEVKNISTSSSKTRKSRGGESILFSTPLNEKYSKDDLYRSTSSLNESGTDASSIFSLGSFNSSYHKSRSDDSLSLLQVSDLSVNDKDLEHSETNKSKKSILQIEAVTPLGARSRTKGRVSLRRVILKASTPKPEKLQSKRTISSLDKEIGPLETSSDQAISLENSYQESNSIFEFKLSFPMTRSRNSSVKSISKQLKKAEGKSIIQSTSLPLKINSSFSNHKNMLSTSVDSNKVNNNTQGWRTRLGSRHNSKSQSSSLTEQLSNNLNNIVKLKSSLPVSSNEIENIKIINSSPVKRMSSIKNTQDDPLELTPSRTNISLGYSSYTDNASPNQEKSLGNRRGRSLQHNIINPEFPSNTSSPNSSIKTVNITPKIKALSVDIESIERRSRLSKISSSNEVTHISPSIVKKRSHSLPSKVEIAQETTPTQNISPLVAKTTGKRGRPANKPKFSDKAAQLDSGSSRRSLSSSSNRGGNVTPKLKALIAGPKSTGKRGRPSKFSKSSEVSHTESLSSPVQKRSRSLSMSKNVEIAQETTPTQNVPSLVAKTTGKKGRPANKPSFLGKASQLDSESSSRSRSSSTNRGGSITPKLKALIASPKSIGKRGRPSKVSSSNEVSQLKFSPPLKKRSQSLPMTKEEIAQETTPKQSISPPVVKTTGKRGRPANKLNFSDKAAQLESESNRHLRSSSSNGSLNITPKLKALMASPKSTGKRGRPSKDSSSSEVSQLKFSPPIKKRSRSLPMTKEEIARETTPTQNISPLVAKTTGKRGRPANKPKFSDKAAQLDSASSRRSLSSSSNTDENITPKLKALLASPKSTGKRGRPSKLSKSSEVSQMELSSSPVQKRSRSLPMPKNVEIAQESTPTQNVTSLVAKTTGKRGRPASKLNFPDKVAQLDSETSRRSRSSSSNRGGNITPMLRTLIASPKSTGKRGRPSKLSKSSEVSQMELSSSPIQKSSRSLSMSKNVEIGQESTPTQNVSSLIAKTTGKRGRPAIKLNFPDKAAQLDSESSRRSRSSSSNRGGNITPILRALIASPKSTGKRGRPSKLSKSSEVSQMELSSSPVQKRSRSLSMSKNVEIEQESTPTQNVTSLVAKTTGKRGRPANKLNFPDKAAQLDSESSRRSRSSSSNRGGNITPMLRALIASPKSTGKRGRPSKVSKSSEVSQMESSSPVKKQSRSISVRINVQETPKQDTEIPSLSLSSNTSISYDNGTKFVTLLPTTEKHSRPSKRSMSNEVTQLESATTPFKKRLSSLSTTKDENAHKTISTRNVTPISESPGKRGRPVKKSNSSDNIIQNNFESSRGTRSNSSNRNRNVTPNAKALKVDPKTGKIGSMSNVSLKNETAHRKSTSPLVKKRSRSLPSSEEETPKQHISPLVAKSTGRRGRPTKINILSSDIQLDSSTELLSNKTIGNCGRPSKVKRVSDELTQIVSSPSVKRRSRSLPTSKSQEETPKQEGILPVVPKNTGKKGRPIKNSTVLKETELVTSTLSVTRRTFSRLSINSDKTLNQELSIPIVVQRSGKKGRRSKNYEVADKTRDDLSSSAVKKHSLCSPLSETATPRVLEISNRSSQLSKIEPVSSVISPIVRSFSQHSFESKKVSSPLYNRRSRSLTSAKNTEVWKTSLSDSGSCKQFKVGKKVKDSESPGRKSTNMNSNAGKVDVISNTSKSRSSEKDVLSSSLSNVRSHSLTSPEDKSVSFNPIVERSFKLERSTRSRTAADESLVPKGKHTQSSSVSNSDKIGNNLSSSLPVTGPERRSKHDKIESEFSDISPIAKSLSYNSFEGQKISSPLFKRRSRSLTFRAFGPSNLEKFRKHGMTGRTSLISSGVKSKLFSSFVKENSSISFSPTKKRLQTEDLLFSSSCSNKTEKNQRQTSKSNNTLVYATHSSTPKVPQNSFNMLTSGIHNLTRFKKGIIKSPTIISPIIDSDKPLCSFTDDSHVRSSYPSLLNSPKNVAMSLFSTVEKIDPNHPINKLGTQFSRSPKTRHSRSVLNLKEMESSEPTLFSIKRNESNKSSSTKLQISAVSDKGVNNSTKKLSMQGNRSLRHSEVELNNRSTNNKSKDTSTKMLQRFTPLENETNHVKNPIDDQYITHETSRVRKSGSHSPILPVESSKQKGKSIEKQLPASVTTSTAKPPVKGRTRSGTISEEIKSPRRKKQKSFVAELSLITDGIAPASITSKNLLGKRKVKNEEVIETDFHMEVTKKPARGRKVPDPEVNLLVKPRRGRRPNLKISYSAISESEDISQIAEKITTRGRRVKQTDALSPRAIPSSKNTGRKSVKVDETIIAKKGIDVKSSQAEEEQAASVKKGRPRIITNEILQENKSRISSEKEIETGVITLPRRRGRPAKPKNFVDDSKNEKSVITTPPLTQRRGRSAKENTIKFSLDDLLSSTSFQNIPLTRKGRKTIKIEEQLAPSKKKDVQALLQTDDSQNIHSVKSKLGKIGRTSPNVSSTKTRSQSVVALKTPKKGKHVISSPVVKSPQRRGKIDKVTQNSSIKTSPTLQRRGRSAKVINSDSEITNVIKLKSPKKEKLITKSPIEKPSRRRKIARDTQNLTKKTSPILQRRGRSAKVINNDSEIQKAISSPQNLHLNVRKGRKTIKIEMPITEEKELKSVSSPLTQRRGRSAVKKDDINLSSPTKKGRKVSQQSKVIKSKIQDKKPLKSAIKKILRISLAGTSMERHLRKSSVMGMVKVGKKAVHFNPKAVNKKKK